MEKLLDIADLLAHQKGLGARQVREVLKTAMINTAKNILGKDFKFEAEIDEKEKEINLFQKQEVVANDDERLADKSLAIIAIDDAKKIDPNVEVEDVLSYEISLDSFGRTGAASLQENLERELQILTETSVFKKYKDKIDRIISGTVTRIDDQENTIVEFEEIRAVLPLKNRIKGEKFKIGDTVKSVVKRVTLSRRDGIRVELSRTTPKFLIELLKLEVPEIKDGNVIVEKAARIPGQRAKVAIFTDKTDIDPVGATVGVKGVRINAISRELGGENIDVIQYSPINELFVARAMSPAVVGSVVCDETKATVKINADQKPKAIGKNGINIRLASMLTGFEIVLDEIASDGIELPANNGEQGSSTKALSELFKD